MAQLENEARHINVTAKDITLNKQLSKSGHYPLPLASANGHEN
jgi:hypothetical protein